jgi:TonB-linked SusC/RagA family outer membrane protein
MKKCRLHFTGPSIALTFLLLSFLLLKTTAYSQLANSTLVKGVVQNMKDEPLSDVSIVIKNAKTNFTAGTVSNSNGSFQFSGIPSGGPYTFTITAVGYDAQVLSGYNLKIETSLTLLVKLVPSVVSMESVVVVGYGSLKRKDLTGSVGSVSSKDFKDLGISRIDQSIAGRVAGVQVKSTSGEPGAAPQIRIRGVGSISAGVSPLYVVDGFPVDNIQTLNPNDIQNIDILKDASATAIYGSRGSNGVVIINTVRGKAGKSTLGFDTYYGMQQVSKIPEMKNSVQQAQWWLDGMRNKNIDDGKPVTGSPDTWAQNVPRIILDILEGKNTTDVEPLESILIDAPQKMYALSASGGTESVRYALSGEFLQQDGIVINSGFERYSVRANIDAKLTERLSLKLNLNPSFTDQRALPSTGVCCLGAGVVAAALNILPHRPMLDDQGNYFNYDGLADMAAVYNPLAVAQETKVSNKMDRLLANLNAEYEITKDLKFNILLGGSVVNTKGMLFKPQRAYFFNDLAFGSDNSSKITNWLSEYTLNYNKSLGKHNITGLVGYTVQKENGESNSLSSNRFPNNLVPTLSAVSNLITAGTSNQYQWTLLSYLARANYNYDSKYYVTASIRTDGSSRFGSENKYGLFPSFALAWRVTNEKFLKNVTFLNELKIRTSYGQTGSNNIGNYDQFATLNYDNYTLGNAAFSGTAPGRLGNPFLTWEKQSSVNVGIDASIFKRRVNITVDHFNSRNTDLLLNVNIPNVTGFSTALQNIGEVKNTGWEFVLNTVNINGKIINWSTDFNLSAYRNEVVKLGPQGDPIYVGNNITKIGQPIGMFFGFLTDGIFKNAAELSAGPIFNPGAADRSRVGDIRFKDISGPAGKPDGIINNFDNTIMGSPYPDFYYGITNRVSYKDIMLSFTVQGSDGSQIYALSRDGGYSGRARVRGYAFSNNYWKSEAEPGDGVTPRPNDTPKGGFRLPNQKYLDNGTYLRVNNITLSYNFPNTWAKKMKLSSLRIYANALNPFLFTKNTAFNPDVSTNDNPLSPGLESNDYPLPKGIIFGLNVKF